MTNINSFKNLLYSVARTVIIAGISIFLWQLIAQPAIDATQRKIESLQVARAAAPAVQLDVKPIGSGQAVVHKGPSATWTSIHVAGNPPKKNCNILGVFFVLGERYNLERYLNEECTNKNVGDALRDYIEDIKKALKLVKNPDAKLMKEALDGLEAFEKLLIERGIFPPPAP